MAVEDSQKYIGFDPVKWVQRLRDVNEGSSFPAADKVVIEHSLRDLQQLLCTQPGRSQA